MDYYPLPYLPQDTSAPQWSPVSGPSQHPQPSPSAVPTSSTQPFPYPPDSAALFHPAQSAAPPLLHYNPPYHAYPYYQAPDPCFPHAPMQLQYPDPQSLSPHLAVHIHSPIPVSAYSTLLPHLSGSASQQALASPTAPPSPEQEAHAPAPSQQPRTSSAALTAPADQSSPDQYVHGDQVMFPTPCDLLHDLATRDRNAAQAASSADAQVQVSADQPVSAGSSTGFTTAKSKSRPSVRKPKQPSDAKPENQRKAYFRSVAENVCFQPTDPDTITSHDKKRLHLECLETYILWLHEQLRLVGKEPVALERVSSYPGLSNRSVRTLLVHMQDEAKKLHEQILDEEQEFFDLQEQIIARGVPVNIEMPDIKRHSIATPMTGLSL